MLSVRWLCSPNGRKREKAARTTYRTVASSRTLHPHRLQQPLSSGESGWGCDRVPKACRPRGGGFLWMALCGKPTRGSPQGLSLLVKLPVSVFRGGSAVPHPLCSGKPLAGDRNVLGSCLRLVTINYEPADFPSPWQWSSGFCFAH